ncbi:MAG: ABC transporter permease [Chloroflexi bacterium]|nr:ABC transporter permease [Chloroflexota bacterium]
MAEQTTGASVEIVRLPLRDRIPGLRFWMRVMSVRLAVPSLVIVLLTTFTALFAPLLAPRDPNDVIYSDAFSKPSTEYWLGTDRLGRDQLSRLIYGARISMLVGVGAVGFAVVIGVAIGLSAAYFGGWVDEVLMRVQDALMAFPSLLLALALVAALGTGLHSIMVAIGLGFVPWVARLIRSQALSVRERDYVLAARSIGAGHLRVLSLYMLPNSIAPVIVQATLTIGYSIIIEASLSFLGVGVQPPTPTWGGMLRVAFDIMERAPWLTIAPGVAIWLVVTAFNFLGDALRDTLDPRLRGVLK